MRYLFLLLALVGCGPSQMAVAAPPTKETIVEALERYHKLTDGKVDTLTVTVGNTNAELEAVKEELKAIRDLLSVPDVVPVPVPPAESPPVKADAPPKDSDRRITFQGKPIDVQAWLRRSVTFVDIRGDVDAHLRDHGLDGDFSGLTKTQKLQLHSVAHSTGTPLKSSKVVVNAAVVLPQSSNCQNGNCARMQYGMQSRFRLFGGRWR